ncbi:MAG: hypothetical protein INF56_00355 [Roseomonas sp.]|nr:hypothetical protein [Roseomonas sp.]
MIFICTIPWIFEIFGVVAEPESIEQRTDTFSHRLDRPFRDFPKQFFEFCDNLPDGSDVWALGPKDPHRWAAVKAVLGPQIRHARRVFLWWHSKPRLKKLCAAWWACSTLEWLRRNRIRKSVTGQWDEIKSGVA